MKRHLFLIARTDRPEPDLHADTLLCLKFFSFFFFLLILFRLSPSCIPVGLSSPRSPGLLDKRLRC